MKQKVRPQVQVGNLMFGGGSYLMCVPLVDQDVENLLSNASASLEFAPDLFEWRVDGFGDYPDPNAVLIALEQLRKTVGSRPILFTPRHIAEGGIQKISDGEKFRLIDVVSRSGLIDLLDIETRYGGALLEEWSGKLREREVKLVISHHDFDQYIKPDEIKDILRRQQEWGADICKIITKIGSCQDLVDFSTALFEAREEFLRTPVIAGAMGDASPLMRVLGDYLGSDMTFVTACGSPSHPTQIHIQQMRDIRKRIADTFA